MAKKVLLLGVLLVVVALTTCGCLGGLIVDIIGGLQDEIAVEAAVEAFVSAWNQQNADGV